MFLLCSENTPREIDLPSFKTRRFDTPSGELRLFWKGSFSTYTEVPGGFRYVEGPPSASSRPHTEICYDERTRSVELRASPEAGTTIYYYTSTEDGLFCASLVFLLHTAGVPIAENTSLLPDYFVYRYVTPPATLFKDIQQLAKASLKATATPEGWALGEPQLDTVFPEPDSWHGDLEHATERTLEILSGSFEDVPSDRLCVPLSGGMDSSVLFQLGSQRHGLSDAYSGGYPFETDRDNREKRYASSAAQALGARHHYHSGTEQEYLEGVVRAIAAAEEPIHHQQSAMFDLLCESAFPPEQDVIALGTGATGAFGTPLQERIWSYLSRRWAYDALATPPLKQFIVAASNATGRARRLVKGIQLSRRLELPLEDPRSIIWSLDAYGSREWVKRYFELNERTPSSKRIGRSRAELLRHFSDHSLLNQISVVDLFDKTQFIWAKILHRHGRIAIFPFMRDDLLHHLHSIPWSVRLRSTKHLLAEVARKIDVPGFILGRAKSGFGVRRRDWALRGGAFDPLVPLAAKVVDEHELRRLQSKRSEDAMTFWNLLNYGIWKRICIDHEDENVLIEELRAARIER